LKAGAWFRRARLLIVSPALRPSWPLSGRNSTYPAVQVCQASSLVDYEAALKQEHGSVSQQSARCFLPLSFPAHVRTWYNAHDPRDVIALYPLNNDNFSQSCRGQLSGRKKSD
jgi:hypothetical protein